MAKTNQCRNCGKQIARRAKRCRSCAASQRNRERFQDPKERRKVGEGLKVAHARGDFNGAHNFESRRKQSEAAKRRKHSKETKRKLSEATRALWKDPEYRRKTREAIRIARQNPEARRKQAEIARIGHARGNLSSPEVRHKRSEGIKAAHARGAYDSVFDNPEIKRKISEASKAAWARGSLSTPEIRHKRSEAAKRQWARGDLSTPEVWCKRSEAAKASWARGAYDGVHDSPEFRRKLSEAVKAARARGAYDGVFQSPTSIELALAAALDICGIEHVSQYRPGGYSKIYDEFVPPDILIEANGDYWHGPERPEAQKRDTEKAIWAEENGYHLVIVWEHEIKEQGAWALVHERVLPLTGNGGGRDQTGRFQTGKI